MDLNKTLSDPDFQALPPKEQDKVLIKRGLKPRFDTSVTGTFDAAIPQTPEQGKGALKATAIGLAGMLPGMGAGAALEAAPIMEGASPLLQGLLRGGTQAIGGVGGGTALTNFLQGKSPMENQGSPANLFSMLAAFGLPAAAGALAKKGSQSLEAQQAALQDTLQAKTGLTPDAVQNTNFTELAAPVQKEFQSQNFASQANEQSQGLARDLISKRLQHLDLQEQLEQAQADLKVATSNGNTQLQQQSQEMVNSLTNQLAQTKTQGSQALLTYVERRNSIENMLDDLERELGKGKASKLPEYQEARRTLDSMKRDYDAAKAQFGIASGTLGEGLTTSKQQPIKIDPSKLPETTNVEGAMQAVAESNRDIKRTQLLQQQTKLMSNQPLSPQVQAADPYASDLLKDLGKNQATQAFQEMLTDPRHLKVALAASPEAQEAIKNNVLNTLIYKSIENNQITPKGIQTAFMSDNGKGLDALRIVLGPAADQGENLAQKLQEFTKYCVQDKSAFTKVVEYGAHYATFRAIIGIGTGRNFESLAGEAAASGAAIASVVAFNKFAKWFFTNDDFRRAAMTWAEGSNVGKISSQAANTFASYIRAMSSNDMSKPQSKE